MRLGCQRLLAWLVLLGSAWSGAAAPVGADPLSPAERAWIDRHGPIRYAPDPEFPPFEFFQPDGRLMGISPEILDLVAQKLRIEFRPVRFTNWTAVIQAVQRGEIDLLSTMTRTTEREQYLRFSQPYLSVPYVLFVDTRGPIRQGLRDLAGRPVGVVRNYGAHAWLREHHPEVVLVPVETTAEGMAMLAGRKLDAMLEILPVGAYTIAQRSHTTLEALPEILLELPQHLAVPPSHAELLGILQKGLDLTSQEERLRIFSRWGGHDLSPGPKPLPLWVWQGMIVLLVAAVLFAVMSFSLRREVARRTRALLESERQVRRLLEALPVPAYWSNQDHAVEFVNRKFTETFGYTREEIGRVEQWFALAQPDPAERERFRLRWETALTRAREGGRETEPIETQLTCRDAAVRTVEVVGRQVGDRLFVVLNDLTARKHAEAVLQQREAFLRSIYSGVELAVFVIDVSPSGELRFLEANPAHARVLGSPGEPVTGARTAWWPSPAEALARDGRNHYELCVETGRSVVFEVAGPRHAGSSWFQVTLTPLREPGGRIHRIVGTAADISERKRAEDALRRSEASLAEAQRIARLGSWESRLDPADPLAGGPLVWSDEVFRIFGYAPGAVTPTTEFFYAAVPPEERERVRAAVLTAVSERRPYQLEHRILRPDGTERTVHEYAEVVYDPATARSLRLVGTVQDITERKHLENQLRQAQKMEAIGQLAGGVAHDFNNILTVILSGSSLLQDDPTLPPEAQALGRQIAEAARRAANLTQQLLTFSRRQVLQVGHLNLNTVIAGISEMLERLLGSHITLVCQCHPDLPSIEADVGMMEQVILNLAINARDAMPRGGRLTLGTAVAEFTPEQATRHATGIPPGRYVTLVVSDNGVGMDKPTLARAFEPFYTTKAVGQGTGLGLAMVYGIVHQHHGWLEVESQLNQGTTFRVHFPAMPQAVAVSPPADAVPSPPARGSETILLVEDEPTIRQLARTCLLRNGYHVIEAANGTEALAAWRQRNEPVDLLLTDLMMPEGVSGRELADQIRARQPGLRVLFTSGYGRDALGSDADLESDTEFLPKPYTPAVLVETVRRCLDR